MKSKRNCLDRDEFVSGLGYAIGWLVNAHDQPTMAGELMAESGFKMSDFNKSCNKYDLKFIRVAARERRLRTTALR